MMKAMVYEMCREIDYEYIAENISNISRIPVSVYKRKRLLYQFGSLKFPKDPLELYLEGFLNMQKKVSYFITPLYHYYGILHHEEYTLILGPTFQIPPSRAQIREYMFLLGVTENYMKQYQDALSAVTGMPIDLFLHFLCMVYYSVSNEKIKLSDLIVLDSSSQISINELTEAIEVHQQVSKGEFMEEPPHDTLDFEEKMLIYVSEGNTNALNQLFSSTSAGQSGKMADNYIRQQRNLFIISTTLISRAAIKGGLLSEEALSLSDRYIQKCEKLDNPDQLMNLQYHMAMDYTTRVNENNMGKSQNKFIRNVTLYVREHLTEDITVDQIAQELYISRSYLSSRFRKESGITLSQYITQQKVKKAQEYLRNTDRTILEISTYLNFSSQGYFQNVFKKITGMTPREYREK